MRLIMKFLLWTLLGIGLFSCGGSKPKTKTKSKPKSSTSKEIPVKGKAAKAVKTAKSYVGTKYKYGGTTRKGIDCSGLMCASYNSVGVTLPRTSNEQSKIGKRIYIGELQVGDLIFFGAKKGSKKITHVGIISKSTSKEVRFVHSSTSRGVIETVLDESYYKPRYIKAVRPLK